MKRAMLIALEASSLGAMAYVAAYQTRAVGRLACPLFARGCEAVADAAFARPMGVPDGLLAVGMYAAMLALAFVPHPTSKARWAQSGLALLNVVTNALGVHDMVRLGHFCFWCSVTAALSVPIAALAFNSQRRSSQP